MSEQPTAPDPAERERRGSTGSTAAQRNLELHARGVEAMNARELSDELFAELCTPDFHLENTSTAVTDKTYHGAAGVREWAEDFFDAFGEDARYEIEEVIAASDAVIVAVLSITGVGVRSGAPLVLRWVNVTRFEGDKMASATGFLGRQDALDAAGLAGSQGP
jgi:ketosteroid isomerase-like protein